MTSIVFRFPAGRYHATPSGHHVNEGHVEWPPSPWRILRALLATGYRTLGWKEVPTDAVALVESLAGEVPSYRLPPIHIAHSRHYMPLGTLDKGREKTTLVFDTWADVGEGAVCVTWPLSLPPDQRALLGELVSNMDYLGRAESWVEGILLAEGEPLPEESPCVPCASHPCPDPAYRQVSVMTPVPPAEFEAWRAPLVESALAALPLPEGKAPPKALLKKRDKATAAYPTSLLDALQWDTAQWKRHRWGQAPGSRHVLYWCRMDEAGAAMPSAVARSSPPPVSCMLLAFATPSRNRSALPVVGRTLPQAELLHRALVSRAGYGEEVACPELTGRDSDGTPLTGHRHARILPLDLDGDGHLDHVLLHAAMGFGALAREAVRGLRLTWQKKGPELRLTLVGSGELDSLRGLPVPLADGITRLLGAEGGALVWQSATPYVPPRFPKPKGTNTIAGQVRRELVSLGLPAPEVTVLPWTGETARLRHAKRVRGREAAPPPVDCGYVLRLTFPERVSGPICVGYASHFGLGQFHAVDPARAADTSGGGS